MTLIYLGKGYKIRRAELKQARLFVLFHEILHFHAIGKYIVFLI